MKLEDIHAAGVAARKVQSFLGSAYTKETMARQDHYTDKTREEFLHTRDIELAHARHHLAELVKLMTLLGTILLASCASYVAPQPPGTPMATLTLTNHTNVPATVTERSGNDVVAILSADRVLTLESIPDGWTLSTQLSDVDGMCFGGSFRDPAYHAIDRRIYRCMAFAEGSTVYGFLYYVDTQGSDRLVWEFRATVTP